MQKITASKSMMIIIGLLLSGLSILGNSVASTLDSIRPAYEISALNRSSFPPGFLFGSTSAAYQIEGAADEDGRGPSIWDTFAHKHPEKIKDRSNGDFAVDSYNRYKEDVLLMKQMGLDAYRFSISWSRLLPKGKVNRGVNQKGVMYYHRLIDEVTANGLKPFVTLFHWDVPQALEYEYGGFRDARIVDDFRDYAELCFREFGDKVKHWITLNEPWGVSNGGYADGSFAPGRCSSFLNLNCAGGNSATEPYLVTHHQLLAHAAAVDLYRRRYQHSQRGKIGITLMTWWMIPMTRMKNDVKAASRALDFMYGSFMDPITNGEYPESMRIIVGDRLPKFTDEQSRMVNGSYDFLGLNYYSARYASHNSSLKNLPPTFQTDSLATLTDTKNQLLIGLKAASDWMCIYPKGIYDILVYTKEKYKAPLIYITENGVSEYNIENIPLQEALDDTQRIQFYHDHLYYVNHAIRSKGVNVKGFFVWSLLDNYEWNAGYTVRFGSIYIDYKNGLTRYPKHSAYWLEEFLKHKP